MSYPYFRIELEVQHRAWDINTAVLEDLVRLCVELAGHGPGHGGPAPAPAHADGETTGSGRGTTGWCPV